MKQESPASQGGGRFKCALIPPTVEYSLAERGKTLIPALESVYQWADEQMKGQL